MRFERRAYVFLDYEHLVRLLGDDWVIIQPNTDLEIPR